MPKPPAGKSQAVPLAPSNDLEDREEVEKDDEETPAAVQRIDANSNPLNPAGDSLDKLIELKMNDDLWKAMLGKLPCLEARDECMVQLQSKAIANSATLKATDERITAIEEKIAEATANNKKTIALSVFEPLVQSYLRVDEIPAQNGQQATKRGFIDKVVNIFVKPVSGLNEVLSLIGLPLFRNASGGDAAAQGRQIAINDLAVKLAEIKTKRAELADKTREAVILAVLDFDEVRRGFQISQEISRRESTRLKLLEVGYRYGQGSTDEFLARQNAMDQRKAETYRTWARMRSQMARIKLLVLGTPTEE